MNRKKLLQMVPFWLILKIQGETDLDKTDILWMIVKFSDYKLNFRRVKSQTDNTYRGKDRLILSRPRDPSEQDLAAIISLITL